MLKKVVLLTVGVLACSLFASAQGPCSNIGGSSTVACVVGLLSDTTGPNANCPGCFPLGKGPIDICSGFDSGCSSPLQTICRLHNGYYQFSFQINTGGRWVKPRVVGSQATWFPTSAFVNPTQGDTSGAGTVENFELTAISPGDYCSF
jgi:hypothetical protein